MNDDDLPNAMTSQTPPPGHDNDTAANAAAFLTRLLAAIDAGEIEATPGQRAYLAGAADTLATLTEHPHTPDSAGLKT